MTSADSGRRPWAAAFGWMVVCSLLFLVIYNACNWITAQRAGVGTWYYEWEMGIPFVPAMILPYWSIDFLFVAGFFVCRDRVEVATLGKRITFAIVLAGACFLLFPFRIAFPRPEVDGILGWMFQSLRAFDQPYNLVPSLHIAFRTILADLYARHIRGAFRLLSHVWFSVIGFSTVLTYQHQIVDVVGGFMLATLCFYAFRERTETMAVTANRRVGSYYLAGAAVLILVALNLGSWALWLLWPSLSLGIVGAAYFGIGPGIYRKEDGRLPLSARLVLGPCLLGQYISLLYYKRQCDVWNEVVPGLWIGCKPNNVEANESRKQGVAAVLDLTCEFSETGPFRNSIYRNIPILDLTAPTRAQLADAVAFIRENVGKGTVFVHCKIGYSRSAAVVGAYLLVSGQAETTNAAIAMMRKARPSLVVRPEAEAALREFKETL